MDKIPLMYYRPGKAHASSHLKVIFLPCPASIGSVCIYLHSNRVLGWTQVSSKLWQEPHAVIVPPAAVLPARRQHAQGSRRSAEGSAQRLRATLGLGRHQHARA